MKLYTEEQVREMIEKSRETGLTADYLILANKGIELPSDEEIDNKLDLIDKYHIMKDFYCDGFKDGAKYIINKIQGGNK